MNSTMANLVNFRYQSPRHVVSGEPSRARPHLPGLAGHHVSQVGQGGQHLGEDPTFVVI